MRRTAINESNIDNAQTSRGEVKSKVNISGKRHLTHPATLPLCLHTPPCLLVSLDFRSLPVAVTLGGNFIEFPLCADRTLDTHYRRNPTSGLGDLALGRRPVRRICVNRIPTIACRRRGGESDRQPRH